VVGATSSEGLISSYKGEIVYR